MDLPWVSRFNCHQGSTFNVQGYDTERGKVTQYKSRVFVGFEVNTISDDVEIKCAILACSKEVRIPVLPMFGQLFPGLPTNVAVRPRYGFSRVTGVCVLTVEDID